MSIKETLITNLKEKTARIGILGLGYVGLPLAVAFAEAGFHVTGIDPDSRKVNSLNQGVSYIPDIKKETVEKLVTSGFLTATTDFSVLQGMDAVSICVPTPLRQTGDPDMSFIVSATDELAKHMHKGMVVVLESTTYPGTTREVLLPKLGTECGLTIGEDWFLAFSPERVDPGRCELCSQRRGAFRDHAGFAARSPYPHPHGDPAAAMPDPVSEASVGTREVRGNSRFAGAPIDIAGRRLPGSPNPRPGGT